MMHFITFALLTLAFLTQPVLQANDPTQAQIDLLIQAIDLRNSARGHLIFELKAQTDLEEVINHHATLKEVRAIAYFELGESYKETRDDYNAIVNLLKGMSLEKHISDCNRRHLNNARVNLGELLPTYQPQSNDFIKAELKQVISDFAADENYCDVRTFSQAISVVDKLEQKKVSIALKAFLSTLSK